MATPVMGLVDRNPARSTGHDGIGPSARRAAIVPTAGSARSMQIQICGGGGPAGGSEMRASKAFSVMAIEGFARSALRANERGRPDDFGPHGANPSSGRGRFAWKGRESDQNRNPAVGILPT